MKLNIVPIIPIYICITESLCFYICSPLDRRRQQKVVKVYDARQKTLEGQYIITEVDPNTVEPL